jgi:tetratricopeptide (TPR) repeat protein
MKKITNTLLLALLLTTTLPAMAEDNSSQMNHDISDLQNEWAHIKYQINDKDAKLEAIHKLEEQAKETSVKYPNQAEPKIWQAIILSTDAGIVKGLSALGNVKEAKSLLEESLKENPNALMGSAHASLGSLYYKVPGWPIAFGDNKEAEKHLRMALKTNPDGIDSNFFYGDFLVENGRQMEAKPYLEHALIAPNRSGRSVADAGRRAEIKEDLDLIDKVSKDKSHSQLN